MGDRQNALSCLGLVLQNQNNITKLEQHIYDFTEKIWSEAISQEAISQEAISQEENSPQGQSNSSKHMTKSQIYNWIVYSTAGLLLKNNDNMKAVALEAKDGKLGWKSSVYAEAEAKLYEHDEFLDKPYEVKDGVIQCQCGSYKTWCFQIQVRSSDEPMTLFARCAQCGHQWSHSG
jgi:DNA-directed RNA polymerase subunit M/transcription elongation factor TFIIS